MTQVPIFVRLGGLVMAQQCISLELLEPVGSFGRFRHLVSPLQRLLRVDSCRSVSLCCKTAPSLEQPLTCARHFHGGGHLSTAKVITHRVANAEKCRVLCPCFTEGDAAEKKKGPAERGLQELGARAF